MFGRFARWSLAPRQYRRSAALHGRLLSGLCGTILDVGCGGFRTKFRLSPDLTYVGLDLTSRASHIRGDAHGLPVRDGSVDWVLLVAVLEHVQHPAQVLAEVCRVLKPDGRAYVAVPFLQMEHAAADYWRWTGQGIQSCVRSHGFEIVDCAANGGVFITLDYLLWHALRQAKKRHAYAAVAALFALKTLAQPLSWLERSPDDPLFATSFHLLLRRSG